jgi:hypothetical protein
MNARDRCERRLGKTTVPEGCTAGGTAGDTTKPAETARLPDAWPPGC